MRSLRQLDKSATQAEQPFDHLMPGTFTHPLAVLPLRRLCPARLNLAALVIGSMSPDFGYYVDRFPAAQYAHTLPGTLTVCLPSGLVALALFYLLRRPLCYLLPEPHRGALMPLAAARPALGGASLLRAAASVLLGSWTHTIWDSFTHPGAWSVEHISILRDSLVRIGGVVFPAFYLLQQVSTFAGASVLVRAYLRRLRRQRVTKPSAPDTFSERQRYALLLLLAAVALAVALPGALHTVSSLRGYFAFRTFVFRAGVYFTAAFIPLIAVSALGLYRAHRSKGPQAAH